MTPAALEGRIDSLPPAKLPALLKSLLVSRPEVHATFHNLSNEILDSEAERKRSLPTANFSSLVSNCEQHINIKYKRLKPSKQFDRLGDIGEVITDAVNDILRTCREDVRSDTQSSGFIALVEIVTVILRCEHHEIKKGLLRDMYDVTAPMKTLFDGMDDANKAAHKDKIRGLAADLSAYGIEDLSTYLDGSD